MAFVTYFIADESVRSSEDPSVPLADQGMTCAAETSTSGRLMPEFHVCEEKGLAPDESFSRVAFSGDHSQMLRLVASAAYQVGALNYAVYIQATLDGPPEVATARVIWRIPPWPSYNWTIRRDMDEC